MVESRYHSANLAHATAARLRMLVARLTMVRGSRVTTSDAVEALMDLAERHPAELDGIVKGDSTTDHPA